MKSVIKNKNTASPTVIDLFAGCGGLSLGLDNAGWRGIFAIEKSPDAFETLKYNLIDSRKHFDWPEWLPMQNHDIKDILKKYKKELLGLRCKVDLVAGGPPCQGFSLAGLRNEKDKRNKLIDTYIKFIDIVRPKMLFFENVRGFTVSFGKEKDGKKYSEYVWGKLENLGYNVFGRIVDFSEFGVPQTRKRFILIGVNKNVIKNKKAIDFFGEMTENKKKFLNKKGLTESISISEAISDIEQKYGEINCANNKNFKMGIYGETRNNFQKLMREGVKDEFPDSHRFAKHRKEITNRFKHIIENNLTCAMIKKHFKLKKSAIKLLQAKKPTPTLTTLPDDYIHYNEPRILTVREYARIQTFPDKFEFKGKYTTGGKRRTKEVPRYTQIGNAIPPLFGEQAGIVLEKMLMD